MKKMNFLLDDAVRRDLEAFVPAGRRSRVVNEAIKREIVRLKRRAATEKLDALKAGGPRVSGRIVLTQLRRDRGSH